MRQRSLRRDALADLGVDVLHLPLGGPHLDLGIDEARRPDQLLGHALGLGELLLPRRGRDADDLVEHREELLVLERPVVAGAGEAEAVVDQRGLAAAVARVHRAHLGEGDVGLVDEGDELLGKVVDEDARPLPGLPAGEGGRVVLDARAIAHLLEHLEIVLGAALEALGLDELVRGHEAPRSARRARRGCARPRSCTWSSGITKCLAG